MYELRRDGEAPLWRPRVDGRALASTSAPSLLGLSSVSEEVRATRAKQHKGALLPPSDPRCRPSGLRAAGCGQNALAPRPAAIFQRLIAFAC